MLCDQTDIYFTMYKDLTQILGIDCNGLNPKPKQSLNIDLEKSGDFNPWHRNLLNHIVQLRLINYNITQWFLQRVLIIH